MKNNLIVGAGFSGITITNLIATQLNEEVVIALSRVIELFVEVFDA